MTSNLTYKNFLSLALIFIGTIAYGQEICNNGIDDDGDGFVDCFDNECLGAFNCEDDFIEGDPDCEVPPNVTSFALQLQSASPNGTASGNGMTAVGDVDGDGFPDIISVNYYNNNVYVLDGRDASIKHQRTLSVRPYLEVMTADIDGDGCAEIFVPYRDGSDYGVMSLSCDLGTIHWTRETLSRPGNIGVADFDGDGMSELYARDEIIDAHTGTMFHSSAYSSNSGNSNFIDKKLTAGGVAVDILDDSECGNCSGQELVIGGLIFSVDINRGSNSANLNLERSFGYRPVYYSNWRQNRTATSVVDYNLDGFLDVIVPGKTTSNGDTRVFFWDVKNNNVVNYRDNVDNWPIGAGRPNIADIDGDGQLNTTFVSGPYLYALDENFNLKWKRGIVEGTSGTTGTTVFDFNGDGEYETVYRDESFLYIVNGNDGSFYTSVPCRSLTYSEYPIVADVNGDGATEICVTCITSNSGDIWDDIGSSQVRIYESQNDRWVPARKVWNQHAYFNVNINDDLTIPRQPQKHHLVWSTGICGAGDRRPLNSFLNQSPFITDQGCPNYAASDLNFAGNIVLNTPQCPDTDFTISFDLSNDGDKNILADVPITFYDGDPTVAGATKLNTVTVPLNIPKKTTVTVSNLTVQGPGTAFTLYIAINHNGINGVGGNPPTPIGYPSGGVVECSYDNNIAQVDVIPTPFAVSAVKVSDNEKCDPTAPDNGEVRAYVLVGGAEVTAGYTFDWYDSNIPVSGAPTHTGAHYANLAAGTYSVTATNNGKMCSSDTLAITVGDAIPAGITVEAVNTQVFSNCQTPNGILEAVVKINGVTQPTSNFTYTWYLGSTPNNDNIIGTNSSATGLNSESYLVRVVDKATGCLGSAIGTVGSTVSSFTVTAIVDSDHTDCATPNGSASANVGGVTAGYTFHWFDGPAKKPLPDHVGDTYSSLAAGEYTVIAIDNVSQCPSGNETITIGGGGSTPVITANVVSNETSCTASNGEVSADVGGVTAGFTFRWFAGQNTDASSEVAGSPSPSLSGLSAGVYTVLVTETGTNCSASEEVTILNQLPTITITPNPTGSSNCDPANGVLSATAAGGTAPYSFFWYIGNVGSPDPNVDTPDFTTQTVNNRAPGDYTLVVTDASSCVSTAIPVEITDLSGTFNLAATSQPQTSCDAANPNGSATATFTGNAGDFTFAWRSGSDNTSGTILSATENLTGQSSGIYTIEARSNTTGCVETFNVTIGNDVQIPTLTESVQHSDQCNPVNGEITISVSVGVPADYTFTWYDGSSVKATGDYGETSNVLSGLAPGFYSVSAVNNVRNCNALSLTNIEVLDNSPTINIAQDGVVSFTPNDCNDVGTIKVDVTAAGNSSGFNIEWYLGLEPFTAAAFQTDNSTTTSTATNLNTGVYTVVATNLDNGCQSSEVYNLPFSNAQELTLVTSQDAQSCPANDGRFEVTLDITGPQSVDATLTLSNFNLRFFEGVYPNGIEVAAMRDDNPPANKTYNNLVPGDYYVIAFSDTGLSIAECPSVPVSVTISESGNVPQLTLTRVDNNTQCEAPFNGILEIDISNGANPADYNITWHRGTNTSGSVVTTTAANDTQANQLQGGSYTVFVEHAASSCNATATYSLIDVLPSVDLVLATTPKTNCDTDGIVVLNNIAENGLNVGTAGYTIGWLESDGITGVVGAAGTTPAGNLFTNDTDYIANVQKGICIGSEQFAIADLTENPKITSAVLTNNTECIDAPNGSIVLEIDGIASPANYTLTWTPALPATAILSNDDATVNGLLAGTYNVRVEKNNAPNRTCFIEATYELVNIPVITTLTVNTTPNTNCPSDENGAIASAEVRVNGIVDAIGNYAVSYFYDNAGLNPIALVDQSALAGGTYFAQVIHNTSTCRTTPIIAFEVEEQTIAPRIDLRDFETPIACASDTDDLGSIEIALANQSSTYTITWSVDGTTLPDAAYPTVDLSDPLDIKGLPEGTYTVTVTNTAAADPNLSCSSTAVYPLTPSRELNIVVSASPVTTCLPTPDGTLTANILNADNSTFDLYWFVGVPTLPLNLGSALAGSPSYQLSDIPVGQYTAVAVSIADPTCISGLKTVDVILEQTPPAIAITEDAALSNCYASLPNGQLSATADGGKVSGYTFEWFIGTNTTGTPDNVGNTYGELTSGIDYTVLVTNLITGCSSTTTQQVSEDFPNISDPTVEVLSHLTNCVTPDGALTATVDGTTDGFRFQWFIGTNTSASPIGVDATVTGLDLGTYTVVATHIETGCTASNTGEILDERITPEFEVKVTDASCGQPNGSIEVTATNTRIDSIVWTGNGRTFSAPKLEGALAGDYTFTVYGTGGCPADGQATIIDEIVIYNGVSANNDGKNDHFIITCIENFENNNVKIYNRAGQIVYEADGYNNGGVKFDGEGNKGIYLTGKDVPDGTYFYIVDKKDGSEPQTGYLELIR